VTFFIDTIFSNTKSIVGNNAAQVWCTADGCTIAFPLKNGKEAYEALSFLFHSYGLPNVMMMDGAEAQVQGDFRRKLRDAGCNIKQTEPYNAKSNLVEGGVREFKRGTGRETFSTVYVPITVGMTVL
jgi:hypothetical protein